MTDDYIEKVLEGDTEAFQFIVSKYKDKAFSIAMSVVKDEFIAQEAVQNAFIKAYTNLDKFKRDSKFMTWFYRIVVNEALKMQEKFKTKAIALSNIKQSEEPLAKSKTLLSIDIENQRYYINKTLEHLSAKYSLALRLFYLEELKIKEISQITDWSESNTKVILHRSREKMKEKLAELFNINKDELY